MELITIINLAIKELRNIKKYATPEELGILLTKIDDLDGAKSDKCIYGLMTGTCFSERAIELVSKCHVGPCFSSVNSNEINPTDIFIDPLFGDRNFTSLEYYLGYNARKGNNDKSVKFVLKYLS